MKVHLVSLGCARNQVDSEVMAGRLADAGCALTSAPEAAEIIVVNTCSFIESAADESIDTILRLAAYKETGRCRRLIVTGCLPERYRESIVSALPEVDVFLGTGAYDQIQAAVKESGGLPACVLPSPDRRGILEPGSRRRTSDLHLAYLKIAEGCSRRCSYCIIPKLRGRQKSRTPDTIVEEADGLIRAGVRELVLVAQDTTAYGRDLGFANGLAGLLGRLASLTEDVWIRIMYGHPESIDRQTIAEMARLPQVCPYVDLPLQHVSRRVLQRMGRHYTGDAIRALIDDIRASMPQAVIRTTFIVGFPGETDADFEELLDFVEQVRFDHLGAFTYSDADDLPSHGLTHHVPGKVAQARYDQLMRRQKAISEALGRRYIGQTCQVLVEEQVEPGVFAGRTALQAPEVDGMTFVHADDLALGDFTEVKIVDAYEYDLIGTPR